MLSSPGPVLYGQERIGLAGKPFRIWKFRTMHQDAEELLESYLESHPELKAEWERDTKLRSDPRVVPYVGTFLRRSSLDEIPQLINVVKGEMSLVGPRPLPPYHLDKFDEPFQAYRATVLPGITGVWQVYCRGEGNLETYVQSDDYYISNWSPRLDFHLLLRTVWIVLSGRGAS